MKELSATFTVYQKNLSQNIAYALPTFSLFFLIAPLNVMPGVYVKYFGLSLGAIALAQLLAPLFDGLTDPLVGYFSDRYRQRFGTRKPLIVAGGLLVLVSSTMLYIPYGWESQQSGPVSFSYLLFFYLAFTLSWTLMGIPHLAWGGEISSDNKGRSQRFSYRAVAVKLAMLLFFIIPLLPFFSSTEVTPETLRFCVYVSWLVMPLCLWICMRWVPNSQAGVGHAIERKEKQHQYLAEKTQSRKERFKQVAKLIAGNRLLLIFYAAYGLVGLGYSMSNGLTFFFVDNYLGLADKLPYAFIANYGVGVPAAWCWGIIAQKMGARATWAIGMTICVTGLLGIGFTPPGEAGLWPYLVCKILIGAGYASTFVAAYMVLASIADYGKWKFDQDCSGTYFALSKTLFKFNTSVGIAGGLLLAQWLGFDPAVESMSDAARMALRLAYIGLPAVLFIVAIIVITRIPIRTHQQSVISKRLEANALSLSID